MFPPTLLKILVFGLAVLVVAFAVVMGAYAFTRGTAAGPDMVSGTLYGVGIGLLILMVIDVLLLLVALGVNELNRRE
jgi:uncharacterized membrane protein